MKTDSVSVTIAHAPADVFAAIADVTRMGEWSPECIACRWVGGAVGPAVGAKFEGDNESRVGNRVVKKWTTTSEVVACEPGSVFEFIADGYTTWRYELEPIGDGTKVTESFRYEPRGFVGKYVYEMLMQRSAMLAKGMQRTLERIKTAMEPAT